MSGAVLVTGAAGYIGGLTTRELSRQGSVRVIATDIREVPASERVEGVEYLQLDITDVGLADVLREHEVGTVVHLAALVNPPPGDTRDLQHRVDVLGTRAVLEAAVQAGVGKLIYTSSGAAYGYSAENGPLLTEADALRADRSFAYAWHKRQVEEDLARYRQEHPELKQLVFRVSTVLGPTVHNQITAMFERPVVVGLSGVATPFCIVSDEDVVRCLVNGVLREDVGVYNLTGDGVLTLREIATLMGRRYLALPERVLKTALRHLSKHELVRYGPEQTQFLAHRPVLDNRRLKADLGYRPRTSREAFERYRASR